jgi:hypothetical protein
MLKREALLTYRSDNEFLRNTALHDAIINNNTALATRYVTLDKEGFVEDGRSIINERSGGNTPLLLALKRGDIETALAILAHPHVDVSLPDSNNLTALHWACMLRQDEVIHALIAKGANPASPWVYDVDRAPLRKTTKELYEHEIDLQKFKRYYEAGSLNSDLFIDGRGYKILGEECYTDIIFHMRELCRNMHWVNTAEFKSDEENIRRECDLFRYNFGQGAEDFSDYHNVIPVNRAIVELLSGRDYAADNLVDPEQKPQPSASGSALENIPSSPASTLQPAIYFNDSASSPRIWNLSTSVEAAAAPNESKHESPSITDILNNNVSTSLENYQTWGVEETPDGYKLYCSCELDTDQPIDIQQAYTNAKSHIQEILPHALASISEAKANPAASQRSEQMIKITIAELSRPQWEEFCRRLTLLESPSSRPINR